jgi:hypothetical protein
MELRRERTTFGESISRTNEILSFFHCFNDIEGDGSQRSFVDKRCIESSSSNEIKVIGGSSNLCWFNKEEEEEEDGLVMVDRNGLVQMSKDTKRSANRPRD